MKKTLKNHQGLYKSTNYIPFSQSKMIMEVGVPNDKSAEKLEKDN